MNNKLRASSGDLLTCFFTECESQFRFLEQKHGYSYLSGLVEYRGGRQIITPYRNQFIDGPFRAVTRYEHDSINLEIVYGDKDYALEAYACYEHIYRLSLSDILSAVKKPDAGRTRHWLVTHEELVQDSVRSIANTVRKQWRHFLNPKPKVIERALSIRSKLMEQAIREQYKQEMDMASREAAKAFLEKDFTMVLMLLMPYERDLSPGDAKKLGLARRSLLETA